MKNNMVLEAYILAEQYLLNKFDDDNMSKIRTELKAIAGIKKTVKVDKSNDRIAYKELQNKLVLTCVRIQLLLKIMMFSL